MGPDWMDLEGQPDLLRAVVEAPDMAALGDVLTEHMGYGEAVALASLPPQERRLLTLALLLVGAIWEDSRSDPDKWLRAAEALEITRRSTAPAVPDGERRRFG